MASKQKLTSKAQEHLGEGENILAAIKGHYETTAFGRPTVNPNSVLLATDKRLVLYVWRGLLGGHDMETFPYDKISSMESGKKLFGRYLAFSSGVSRFSMRWIRDDEFPVFIETVKGRMEKNPTLERPASTDIPGQIKKLSDLKDAGVLTNEEFEKKKAELLAKM